MQKIGDSTPTANDVGEFSEGNPSAGVEPTWLTAAWHNTIQRELIAVVSSAGLPLDPEKDDQMLEAVQVLIRQAVQVYALDTGVANAYSVAYTPSISALTDGMVLRFKAKTANTGASTFAPNGLGAKSIVGLAQVALQGAEIAANGFCTVAWSSSMDKWILLDCSGGASQIAPASASNHAVSVAQHQSGYGLYASAGGVANAYTATFSPVITALTDGMVLRFKAATPNTGPSTFSPNGLSPAPIIGGAHSALQGGEIVATGDVWVQWNSSIGSGSWVLVGCTGGAHQVAPAAASQHAVSLDQLQKSYAWQGGFQSITSTSSFTVPSGVYRLRYRIWGGGGGGGGLGSAGNGAAGGGGSAGFSEGVALVTPGQVIACTIGAAGGGGGIGGGGGTGGTTTFGTIASATGGGGGAVSSPSGGGGGSGGVGSLGQNNLSGGSGGSGGVGAGAGGSGAAAPGGGGGSAGGGTGIGGSGSIPGGGAGGSGGSSVNGGSSGGRGQINLEW